jgi:hypothetical protein
MTAEGWVVAKGAVRLPAGCSVVAEEPRGVPLGTRVVARGSLGEPAGRQVAAEGSRRGPIGSRVVAKGSRGVPPGIRVVAAGPRGVAAGGDVVHIRSAVGPRPGAWRRQRRSKGGPASGRRRRRGLRGDLVGRGGHRRGVYRRFLGSVGLLGGAKKPPRWVRPKPILRHQATVALSRSALQSAMSGGSGGISTRGEVGSVNRRKSAPLNVTNASAPARSAAMRCRASKTTPEEKPRSVHR